MNDADATSPMPYRRVTPFVGHIFLQARESQGLTQACVAARAGVSRSTVSDFENGKRPNLGLATVELLAHAVGTTFTALSALADEACQRQGRCRIYRPSRKASPHGVMPGSVTSDPSRR